MYKLLICVRLCHNMSNCTYSTLITSADNPVFLGDAVSSLNYFERILSQSELTLALSFKIQSSNIMCDIYMTSIQAYLNSICVHEGLVLVLKSTRPRREPSRPRPRPRPERSNQDQDLSSQEPRPRQLLARPRPQNRVSRRS